MRGRSLYREYQNAANSNQLHFNSAPSKFQSHELTDDFVTALAYCSLVRSIR